MQPGFTAVPNDLFEAALRFKCPLSHKELLFAIIRLTEGYHKSERALSISYIAKFLGADKSNIARRLKSLIEANVLKETSSPGYQDARHIEINRNFKEWIPGKNEPVKRKTKKKNLPSAAENTPDKAASEIFLEKNPETTTVAVSTTPPMVELTTNKNTSSLFSNNKTAAVAVVLKKGNRGKSPLQQQLSKGNPQPQNEELEEMLASSFERSLGRKPNFDEVFELKKQVVKDERFTEAENVTILKNAFHRIALCEEAKRHTVYILGIIRSMKLDKLKERDRILKAQETSASEKPKFTSWDEAGFSLIEDFRKQFQINISPGDFNKNELQFR